VSGFCVIVGCLCGVYVGCEWCVFVYGVRVCGVIDVCVWCGVFGICLLVVSCGFVCGECLCVGVL